MHILGVGIATLDLVFVTGHYPAEDEEMRAQSLRISRGGNATNTLVMLSQLGHACHWAGVLASAPESAIITSELDHYSIDYRHVVHHAGRPPTSSITLTGHSRTIVHYRDLPELTAAEFAAVPLTDVEWVHFEGRAISELKAMVARVRAERPDCIISIEAEKWRDGLESVLALPDVLIAGKALAAHLGMSTPDNMLDWLRKRSPAARIALAWGALGAYGDDNGQRLHAPAAAVPELTDTLGAGDAFNAGLIDALARRQPLPQALAHANQIAAQKCGRFGFELGA